MRKFIAILVLLFVACWFVLQLRVELKYDHARRTDFAAYSVTPMDQQTIAFLANVQTNWTCWADVTNGPDADMLKLVGKSSSVQNLIETFNYQMPPYSWFSPSRNRNAAALNLVKAEFMPASLDKEWHVSADEHTAFLLCNSHVVALYRDVPGGLRASYYTSKKVATTPSNVTR